MVSTRGLGLRSAIVACLLALNNTFVVASPTQCTEDWVTIWGTMPQLTEPANLPPAPFNQTGLVFANSTIRQTVKVSLDAQTIRLQLTNVFGGSDLPITAASIALPSNGSAGISSINTKTVTKVTFSGSESFIIPNGAIVISDPIHFPVKAQSVVTINLFLQNGQTTNSITSHPGSRTTSYFVNGNHLNDADLVNPAHVEHWYFLAGIEGYIDSASSTIAFVGDSITDGRESTNNLNNRWPDQLLAVMQKNPATKNIAILNEAAGGNRILVDGLGPNALGRIDRDVLAQSGVKYCIIFEGVNDIGVAATDAATQQVIGDRLIEAYGQMISRIHRFHIPVFGATITPFSGPGQTYSDPTREKTRQRVNKWIRTSGRFDAVIDFDKVVRNQTQPDQLNSTFNSGDYLHPNVLGYETMGKSIDLTLFKRFENGVSGLL